ncbi:hypothetical protein SCNRRL3882_3612 [Streptomyces chartreusis NRRL 3882]|uniref:Uncharacterized protein n=1 Tax=Streptomyces chartreusis NRRL 3882 TaxID=1079985 RepID=A0A2N9B9Z1_STRCX|nr:hypothetical protein SCNRRL3882_3612 [Streptomyces chartreusis NRRL 3882]
MNTGHPRDVDPSITGQPHQVTGKVPDLMGIYRGRLVPRCSCQRRYEFLVPPHLFAGRCHAAPRCNASHTAIDSRAPSSTALPQWAIQAAMPSAVPERYPSRASR